MRLCEEYRSRVEREKTTLMARKSMELTDAMHGKVRELMEHQKRRTRRLFEVQASDSSEEPGDGLERREKKGARKAPFNALKYKQVVVNDDASQRAGITVKPLYKTDE